MAFPFGRLLQATVLVLGIGTCIGANADDHLQKECAGPAHLKPECIRHGTEHAASMPAGEITSLNRKANTVTLRFGDRESASKTFPVQSPSMLSRVRAGDKVRITTQKINGKETITELQAHE